MSKWTDNAIRTAVRAEARLPFADSYALHPGAAENLMIRMRDELAAEIASLTEKLDEYHSLVNTLVARLEQVKP